MIYYYYIQIMNICFKYDKGVSYMVYLYHENEKKFIYIYIYSVCVRLYVFKYTRYVIVTSSFQQICRLRLPDCCVYKYEMFLSINCFICYVCHLSIICSFCFHATNDNTLFILFCILITIFAISNYK